MATIFSFIAATGLLAVGLTTGPAQAKTAQATTAQATATQATTGRTMTDSVQRVVSLSGLDLSSAPGRRAARLRLDGAATVVCLEAGGDAAGALAMATCQDEALRDAGRQLARLVRTDAEWRQAMPLTDIAAVDRAGR